MQYYYTTYTLRMFPVLNLSLRNSYLWVPYWVWRIVPEYCIIIYYVYRMYILSTMLFFTSPVRMLTVLSYTVYLVLEYNSTKLCVPFVYDIGLLYSSTT